MTILDRPQTTAAIDQHGMRYSDVAVATGLVVDPDFGTTAGVAPAQWLRPTVFFVTAIPRTLPAWPEQEDTAAVVRVLRERIASHGLSRQDIARAIGVDRRSLSGYVSGEIRPSGERLDLLRVVADLADMICQERPGQVRDVFLTRRGRLALIDQVEALGSSVLTKWQAWLTHAQAIVSVTARATASGPIWAAAARALQEGRLESPRRAHTIRPESTYEMDLAEAAAFEEPGYKSGRQR